MYQSPQMTKYQPLKIRIYSGNSPRLTSDSHRQLMVIVKSKSSLNNQSQVLWEMLWVNMATAPFKSCLASLTQIRQQTNSSSFVLRKRGTFAFFVPNIEKNKTSTQTICERSQFRDSYAPSAKGNCNLNFPRLQ